MAPVAAYGRGGKRSTTRRTGHGNSRPIGNDSADKDVSSPPTVSSGQAVDSNQSDGPLVPGNPILLQQNNQSLRGSSFGERGTHGAGRGRRRGGRRGVAVQRIRRPIQIVPEEPFVLDAFARNGKSIQLPGSMKQAYESLARFMETIYDGIPKMLGVPRPYEWEKDKLVCNYREFRTFITTLNIRLEEMTGNQHHDINFPPRFKRLLNSPKLNLTDAIDVLDFAYSMAVPNPAVLNTGRDDETYGEVTPRQMASIFSELQLNSKDVFLDMGSGVGQLVMLASLITPVKRSIGIEKFDIPAKLAVEQKQWLSRILGHIGKRHKPFELFHDDFTKIDYLKYVRQATVIFINNLKFKAELMTKIKQMLVHCEDGRRIVTTEKLVLGDRTANTSDAVDVIQDLNDIDTFVEEKVLRCIGEDCVSWTKNPIDFYLYTIKRK